MDVKKIIFSLLCLVLVLVFTVPAVAGVRDLDATAKHGYIINKTEDSAYSFMVLSITDKKTLIDYKDAGSMLPSRATVLRNLRDHFMGTRMTNDELRVLLESYGYAIPIDLKPGKYIFYHKRQGCTRWKWVVVTFTAEHINNLPEPFIFWFNGEKDKCKGDHGDGCGHRHNH